VIRLKKLAIWKNTPAPKFQRPKGLNLKNADDKNRLDTMEKQHAIKYETLAKEREMMRGWIRAIEEREKLNTSTQKMTEDEITKVLKEKGEERRQIRDERLAKAEKLVCSVHL
jgi:hypothetical protein